jgi:tubulin polyglutamylase TTLL6/13
LQKIKDSKDVNNHGRECCSDDSPSDVYLDKHHNWSNQFAWEDTHLGGYRRIMPSPNDRQRYQKFQVQQNQLSVYSETAASKRREECAKQQRIELEEKFKYNQSLLRNFKLGKSLTGEEDSVKKKKPKKQKRNFFKPDDISDSDERDRVTSMQQREYLIKTVGLLQTVSCVDCEKVSAEFT